MKEDVRQQRPHEEKRGGAGIFDSDDAGFMCSTEVTGDNLQPASRRAVIVAGVERDDERRVRLLVHAEHEVLADRRAGEGHPFFRNTSKDDARIRCGIDMLEVGDAGRQLDVAVHRGVEEGLLRVEVAQDGGGGDVKPGGDIGERGRRKALLGEHFPCCLKDLIAVDEWRPAHL